MRYSILIVDDDKEIIEMLKDHFDMDGFLALTARNSDECLNQLSKQPDIILLDINMPGKDGMTLCKEIRNHVVCPIIFLTARTTDQDKINALNVGGDEYITKPFSLKVLTAIVQSHLRREERRHNINNAKFTNGLCIDYAERKVYFNNEEIPFSKREFDIIEFLSMNAGQVFSKDKIYDKIWGLEAVGDSQTVKEHVRNIRLKFTNITGYDCIETVRGIGFRWVKG